VDGEDEDRDEDQREEAGGGFEPVKDLVEAAGEGAAIGGAGVD
jgi:hypothetical protein